MCFPGKFGLCPPGIFILAVHILRLRNIVYLVLPLIACLIKVERFQ